MRLLEPGVHLSRERVGLLLRDHFLVDELLRVLLAHARLALDQRGHQRLRVRSLVLLVVAVPAVADEVDDDVGAEAAPEGEGEADRGQRGLGIVGVDVDDRKIEALGEVARVARRAPVGRIGREADLVVRDQVQRAAGRVASQVGEVQRLRDHALRREGRVAVDLDRHRDRRVVVAGAARAVGLLGARASLDDGVDRFEMARVRGQRERDVAGRRLSRALRAEVVLDVAGAAFWVGGDRLERPLALELPQERLVRAAEHMREDVEPPAMRHAEHDLVRAFLGTELDRLVEHRDHHVEPLDRELLLAEERAAEVALEALDLGQALEQAALLVGSQRSPVAPGLDRRAQPDALLVVGDVLDLVRARAAVGLSQPRQHVGQRLAGDVDAEDVGRDQALELGGQLRLEALRLERRVADRLRAERIEAGGEVPVGAVGLDERHRRRDGAEQGPVRAAARPARREAAQQREPPRAGAAATEPVPSRRGRCRPPPAGARPTARGPGGSPRARSRRSRRACATRSAPPPGSRGTARGARSRSPR